METIKYNESAERIKFMECRMAGQKDKFVMQITHPQCLYQVLEFKNMDQFWQFNKKNNEVYSQVGSRMMAVRFTGCIQHFEFDATNASERGKYLITTMREAAKWYDEFLNENNKEE